MFLSLSLSLSLSPPPSVSLSFLLSFLLSSFVSLSSLLPSLSPSYFFASLPPSSVSFSAPLALLTLLLLPPWRPPLPSATLAVSYNLTYALVLGVSLSFLLLCFPPPFLSLTVSLSAPLALLTLLLLPPWRPPLPSATLAVSYNLTYVP